MRGDASSCANMHKLQNMKESELAGAVRNYMKPTARFAAGVTKINNIFFNIKSRLYLVTEVINLIYLDLNVAKLI